MPEQIEVEIALRDSISTGLRQVGREIDAITRKMREGGDSGTDVFSRFSKGAQEAKQHVDKTKESVSGLSSFMVGMSRTLLGATGAAAGIYAVGEALENVAKKRVGLQNLSVDLGFTSEKISAMRRTLERMGLETNEQNQIITRFGQNLKDIFRLQAHSPFMTELQNMSEQNFAAKLQAMVNAGADLDQTMKAVAQEWARLVDAGKPEAAKHFSEIFQIPESVLKNIHETGVDIKGAYQANEKIAQEYLQNVLKLEHQVDDLVRRVQEKGMEAYNSVFRAMKLIGIDFSKVSSPSAAPSAPAGPAGPFPQFVPNIHSQEPKKMGTFGFEDALRSRSGGIADYVEQGMREEDKKANRLLGEIADSLKLLEVGRGGTTTGGGRFGIPSSGTLGGSEPMFGAPSSGTLPSSDFGTPPLAPSFTPTPGGSGRVTGGGGTPSPIHGPSGLGRVQSQTGGAGSQHAPIQTQQPLTNSSVHGGLAAARSRFAEELKDPQVRDRLIAYTAAEVGNEGPQAAQAFMETTLNRAASRGKSIRETLSGSYFPKITHSRAARGATDAMREKFGSHVDTVLGGSNISGFATGNASGTVGFAGGPQTLKAGGERFGIEGPDRNWAKRMQAASGMGEAGGGGGDGGSGAPPSDVLAKAREVAMTNGPGGVQAFMRQQGYPKSGAWCGQFAASVVTATGGKPPRNPAVASNWRNWGEPTSDPQPGDVAIRKRAATGDTGSHVTFVESVDAKRGAFKGLGGNQGGGKLKSSQFSLDRFEYRRAADREKVDQSLQNVRNVKTTKGSVKAEIDFSNMPTARTKSGDEEGKFKLLKVQATPQGAKDSEGMLHPGDSAHTPYVP